jgi:hypothetical protein
MRLLHALIAFSLTANVQAAGAAEGKDKPSRTDQPTTRSGTGGALLADCTETVVRPSPLPPRPVLRRATLAGGPTKARHHHRRIAKKARPHVHRKHRPRHQGHRPVHRRAHHRPAATRSPPILHRVSYASPLCAERSPAMNTLLGLPPYEVTQTPVAVEPTPLGTPTISTPALVEVDLTTPPPAPVIIFPYTPIYPAGPGPVLVPLGPEPPPPPPALPRPVPEPGSWAMMLLGILMVGGAIRRRRRKLSLGLA